MPPAPAKKPVPPASTVASRPAGVSSSAGGVKSKAPVGTSSSASSSKAPASGGSAARTTTTTATTTVSSSARSGNRSGPNTGAVDSNNNDDTYRTPTDEVNSKKAEVSAVRDELEAFEARLESGIVLKSCSGSGGGSAPHGHRPPSSLNNLADHKKVASAQKQQKTAAASDNGAARPSFASAQHQPIVSGSGLAAIRPLRNTPPNVTLTEEEVELRSKRQAEISEVRNLPGAGSSLGTTRPGGDSDSDDDD